MSVGEQTMAGAEGTLSKMSPAVRHFVEEMLRHGRVGLGAPTTLRVTDLKSGCPSLTPSPCCDRFKLHIPYAGDTIKWDVIFNHEYPDIPPDFMFGEDTDFFPDPDELPHLQEWRSQDPEALLLVLQELLAQFQVHQRERLRDNSRLMFEYNSLSEQTDYTVHMEVHVGRHTAWDGECCVRFLLRLPVDFSLIPPYLLKDPLVDPGEDVALLLVTFENTEATKVFPKLYLSPRIEHALGGSSAFHIPNFPSGGCLLDYVPQVCQLLTSKVQYITQGYQKRREYIAAFLSHFGESIAEYDAEGFTKISLLLEGLEFFFMVHIELPLYFPRDQPTFTFQSVYQHGTTAQPFLQVQKSYPYSPRWDGNEMAKRARVYFEEFSPQFREAALANGKP
ncbi:BRISC and BRCA1-A complex member 2 isoform X2 [Lethenteron reissneri]|uniref:BRISC and BRCA1-A complex member 2 isoform X2 n=1 Tax=Lethenteron reissneri TaxID=7753 RepID=UPI002AB7D379|nr:BRISC and BRCA1-A complex member 2 isoform X2 [Lethenteron reissneri]